MLNLATNPFVNRRRFYALSGLAAVVLTISLIVLVALFVRNFRSERGVRRQIATYQAEMDRLDISQKKLEEVLKQPEAADVMDRSEFLNALIREKSVSWTRIFMDLEKIMPERVMAVMLHPAVKVPGKNEPVIINGPLRMDLSLSVNSDKYEPLVEFVKRLENSDKFNRPEVQHDSGAQTSGPSNGSLAQAGQEVYNLTLKVGYVQ